MPTMNHIDTVIQLVLCTTGGTGQEVALPWLETLLSPLMSGTFLGMDYWLWAGIVFIITIGFILDLIVRTLLRAVLRSITTGKGDESLALIIKRVPRPAGTAAGGGVWLFMMPMLGLPLTVSQILEPAIHVYITIACIWFGFRGTDLISWVAEQKAQKSANKLDDLLVPLLRKSLKAIVIVFGFVYLADSLQIQLAPIIAGLGIGGLGFAFAAKDTIENFFGSITVILDKPFTIGDWIVIDGIEGTVDSVGIRSTRIRTFYDSIVTIPNSILVTSKCDNYSRRRYRRWKQIIGIGYSTPPETIAAFCEGIRELLRLHPYTRKDYYQVWLTEFGGSSLNILVYVFWTAPDWQTELRERHRFILDIIRLAGELQVEFAFPTRTLYMRKETDWENGPKKIPAKYSEDWMKSSEVEGKTVVEEFTADDDWRQHTPPPYHFTGARDGDVGGGGEGGEG